MWQSKEEFTSLSKPWPYVTIFVFTTYISPKAVEYIQTNTQNHTLHKNRIWNRLHLYPYSQSLFHFDRNFEHSSTKTSKTSTHAKHTSKPHLGCTKLHLWKHSYKQMHWHHHHHSHFTIERSPSAMFVNSTIQSIFLIVPSPI